MSLLLAAFGAQLDGHFDAITPFCVVYDSSCKMSYE